MNTRNNRSSAINVSSPWRGMLPNPDGTVGQADRQHVAYIYAGISAGGASVTEPTGRRRRTKFYVGPVFLPEERVPLKPNEPLEIYKRLSQLEIYVERMKEIDDEESFYLLH